VRNVGKLYLKKRKRRKMILTINVTEEDIKHGKPRICSDCPVALAILRAICTAAPSDSDFYAIKVTSHCCFMWLDPSQDRIHTLLPYEAINFIDKLDRTMLVKPFTFDLKIPDEFTNQKT
jgi:hypothetical protein